jgi:hypothetical protein
LRQTPGQTLTAVQGLDAHKLALFGQHKRETFGYGCLVLAMINPSCRVEGIEEIARMQ